EVLKFSGLAVQMGATIAVFVWVGRQLDSYFNNRIPLLTIIFSLLGIGSSLYIIMKDAKRKG
ncbi:MAG: AtpZ/AtpI family protein, partial [Flavobacteriales bacterium]